MIVANEDQFVGFAINSVLPFVDQLIVFDTGSTDKTVEVIRSIKSPKIVFEEKGQVNAKQLVALRNEQIRNTKTEFFMLVDGDEIWPKRQLEKFVKEMTNSFKDKLAFFCRTRNAVGDIYHYLPESAGRYHIDGQVGHLSMRGFRNVSGLALEGKYPLETYTYQGKSLNNWEERLQYVDVWYLHTTHLQRSSENKEIMGFRRQIMEKGISFSPGELPEVLPESMPRRPVYFEIIATIITPFKEFKRHAQI